MTPQQTKYYKEAMKMIEAKEMLNNMEATSYPHSDKLSRDKIHKKWNSRIKTSDVKVLKTTELKLI